MRARSGPARSAITSNRAEVPTLSPREREILVLRKEGKMFKEVAEILGLSMNTVQSHARNAFCKLRVGSTLQAIRFL